MFRNLISPGPVRRCFQRRVLWSKCVPPIRFSFSMSKGKGGPSWED